MKTIVVPKNKTRNLSDYYSIALVTAATKIQGVSKKKV